MFDRDHRICGDLMDYTFHVRGIEFVCQIVGEGSGYLGQVVDFPELGIVRSANVRSTLTLLEKELKKQWHYDSRSEHQFRVDVFMHKIAKLNKMGVRYTPTEKVSPAERLFRAKLIMEEALELVNKGLGIEIYIGDQKIEMERINWMTVGQVNLLEVADGCADLKVVTTGTLSCFGFDDLKIQAIVDFNNLTKFGPGHRIVNGKLVKPDDFVGPQELLLGAINESQRPSSGGDGDGG
jgi:predicted HAD superfamily Cof-like phosphohydrolase